MCFSTIWSVISILKLTARMLFKMLSDAAAYTEGILRYTHGFGLTYHSSIYTSGMTLFSAVDIVPYSSAIGAYGLISIDFY